MRRIGGHIGETKPTEHVMVPAKVFVVAEQDSRGHAASLRALAAADMNGAKIFGPTAGVIEAFLCDGGPK